MAMIEYVDSNYDYDALYSDSQALSLCFRDNDSGVGFVVVFEPSIAMFSMAEIEDMNEIMPKGDIVCFYRVFSSPVPVDMDDASAYDVEEDVYASGIYEFPMFAAELPDDLENIGEFFFHELPEDFVEDVKEQYTQMI